MYKRIIILVIAAAFIILSLSACKREARDAQLAVIHPDYYISPGGILYEDIKNVSYKCYFDFESRSNLLLCYDPECAHSSISCLARQNHPYTFFTADKLYYLAIDLLTFIDNSQAVITGIYESDITKPEPKLLLEFEGSPVSEIYYRDNMLYVPAVIQKYDKAGTSSVQYCIYRINLKKNKLARSDIPLKGGFNEKYIPSGLIDNKLILQHSYYDRIISPSDYGLKGDATDLVSNKENYAKYRQELMKAAHEDMYYYDLGSGKLRSLDLPVPLLVHGGRYYYNKKSDEGFSLFSLQLDLNEESEITSQPAYEMQAFGNSLFVREGIVAATDTAGQEYIDYDTDSLAYCIQRTDTGESIKIINSAFAEKEAEIKLVAEYRDYYIFFYSCLREGIHKRIGYIDKDDFHNDRDGIVLPAPF